MMRLTLAALAFSLAACGTSAQQTDLSSTTQMRRDDPLGRMCFEAMRRGLPTPEQCKAEVSGVTTLKVVGGARLPTPEELRAPGKPRSVTFAIGVRKDSESTRLQEVTRVTSDADGRFSLRLEPGEYYVMPLGPMTAKILRDDEKGEEPQNLLEQTRFQVYERQKLELNVDFTGQGA